MRWRELSSVVSRYFKPRSWLNEPADWLVLISLMMLVGSRHVWSIVFWEFSGYAISFSDLGAVFPAVVATLLIYYSASTRQLFRRVMGHSRILVFAIAAFWLWVFVRAVTTGDISALVSVTSQSSKAIAVLVILVALIGKVGSSRALNSFFIIGIATVLVSMIWYVVGVIEIAPTFGSDGQFHDRSLWIPKFGYEAAYGKVLQYEGLAQDPNLIAVVYSGALFGGVAAAFNRRRGDWLVLAGLVVIQMAVILTLSRSAGLTAIVVLVFLLGNAAWFRNRTALQLLRRYVVPGLISIGILALGIALVGSTSIGDRYGLSFDDAISMVETKSVGNIEFRFSYQQEALSDSLKDVPTAVFGHGAKATPEGISLIENGYLWVLYQYGLIGMGIAIFIGVIVLMKLRNLDKSKISVMILLPFALWLATVSVIGIILYGVALWSFIALVLIETDSKYKTDYVN